MDSSNDHLQSGHKCILTDVCHQKPIAIWPHPHIPEFVKCTTGTCALQSVRKTVLATLLHGAYCLHKKMKQQIKKTKNEKKRQVSCNLCEGTSRWQCTVDPFVMPKRTRRAEYWRCEPFCPIVTSAWPFHPNVCSKSFSDNCCQCRVWIKEPVWFVSNVCA